MQRQLRVTVDGHVYEVTVEDLTDTGNLLYPAPNSMSAQAVVTPGPAPAATPGPAAPAAAPPPPAADGAGAVVSPMSGVLQELLVTEGQEVQAGDTVAVIEAMKMKTPLVTDHGGTVGSIALKVGDGVQAGQTVLNVS